MKNWIRKKLLELIGRDIENIARDAYHEGCYVTQRRMQAEKLLEFQQLTATNEKLRELMVERANLAVPEIISVEQGLNQK